MRIFVILIAGTFSLASCGGKYAVLSNHAVTVNPGDNENAAMNFEASLASNECVHKKAPRTQYRNYHRKKYE